MEGKFKHSTDHKQKGWVIEAWLKIMDLYQNFKTGKIYVIKKLDNRRKDEQDIFLYDSSIMYTKHLFL